MTFTRCARCDFRATDDEPLAAHAIGAGHPLCPICLRSLTDTDPAMACEHCLTHARELLSGIVTMYGELGEHLGHLNGSLRPQMGRSSDGAPLVGGNRLVMLGHGSAGYQEDGDTSKDADPPSIAFELGWWAMDWSETRGDRDDLGATPARIVLKAAGYLERKMRWAANSHLGFDGFLADLKRLHLVLEHATARDTPVEKAGAKCFECQGDLIRVVDRDTGVSTEDVMCNACRANYDPQRYKLALRAAWEQTAGWITLPEAARAASARVETVETWAKRGQVDSACRVEDGRKLVWWPDVQARKAELQERARRAAEAKAQKALEQARRAS